MKAFIVALSLIALSCDLFSFTEAAPKRQKRTLWQELCPKNIPDEQCTAYVKEQSKNNCQIGDVGKDYYIYWQGCGTNYCGKNTRSVAEDLSKPYPDCCQHCEVIDPSKPYEMSGVL